MLVLLGSTPAGAQPAELPVYVSDQFQSVAKKASRQLITAHISSACPSHKPLCKPLVEQLAAATDAALSKDEAGLKRALNTFFVQSSVAGLIEFVLGDLADTRNAEHPELAKALEPVAQCLVASVMAGRQEGQTLEECKFTNAQLDDLRKQALALVCQATPDKCPVVSGLVQVLEKRPIRVDEVAFGLAQVLESPPLHRRREGLLLYGLGDFLARAPREGLFEASWSFLTLPERQPHVWERFGAAERIIASGAFFERRFLSGAEDDQILQVFKDCGQPTQPFEAWTRARANLPAMREALLTGKDISEELQPLKALLDIRECTAGDADQQQALRRLRNQIQENLVPLEFRSAVRRYGVLALSAAALLDYVRSSNEQELNDNLARTTVFGVAQAVAFQQVIQRLQAERASDVKPEARLTGLTAIGPGDMLGTCEFQRVSALLGQPYPVADPAKPTCYSLDTRKVAPGITNFVDLGVRSDIPAEVEAKGFAQLLKHAWFQQNLPPGVPRTEQVAALVQASEFFLGAVMASEAPAVTQAWGEIRDALNRIHASAGDVEARSKLQAQAYNLVKLVPAPTSGLSLNEEQFVQVMLARTTPEQEARLEATLQKRLARLRQLEALQSPSPAEQSELVLLQARSQRLPPLRMVRAFVEQVPIEQRAPEVLKVLRGLLRALHPELLDQLDKVMPVNALTHTVQDGLEQRDAESRGRMMRLGADFLVEQVDKLALRIVGTNATQCQEKDPKWRSIFNRLDAACTAHMLIQGAYHPIADYLSAGGFSAPGAARLADTTYRQLLQSPMLGSTPVILNVGLGANWVGFNKSGSDFVSLTVIDKFGLALLKYNGPSNGFEAGPFVGGFLDALVRTASGAEDKYWLAGFTVGMPRIAGVDLGLEAHVAGAIPFTFSSDPRLTLGLSVVVPFSTVFDSDE
jgi:hypothetical protein